MIEFPSHFDHRHSHYRSQNSILLHSRLQQSLQYSLQFHTHIHYQFRIFIPSGISEHLCNILNQSQEDTEADLNSLNILQAKVLAI